MKYIIEVSDGMEVVDMLLESILEPKPEVIMFEKINSDEIRSLQEYDMVDNRVFVLFDLDNRFKEQNMLLKTLEESENHFVLLVESINNLLPTVQSRCIFQKSHKPKTLDITAEIEEMVDKVVNLIGQASNANLFTLVNKVDNLDCEKPYLQFLDLLNGTYGKHPKTYEKQLYCVGKAKSRIERAPSMEDSIFTVMLLDLKELG